MTVYIVNLERRWTGSHTYVCNVYSTFDKAVAGAKEGIIGRGYKYEAIIEEMTLDEKSGRELLRVSMSGPWEETGGAEFGYCYQNNTQGALEAILLMMKEEKIV